MIALGIAIAYALSGLLGLFLAVPPGYATVVWPAAGIALGAILVFGNRYAIGVWLGSFIANLSVDHAQIGLAMLIAVGAALQAVVGAELLRRYLRYPDKLYDIKKILIFFLLGAVLSSVINASWSNAFLWYWGILSASDVLYNWITWWGGDALGILVFTQIVLVFFEKPRDYWRQRIHIVVIPLCVLFVLSVVIFSVLREKEIDDAQEIFSKNMSSIHVLFREKLYDTEKTLSSLQSLFDSSQVVTRDEFQKFVSRFLKKNDSIYALSWSPIVNQSDRARFISEAKKEGLAQFEFLDLENKTVHVDKVRDKYYVVFYIEPREGNERALGYNLGSDENRYHALKNAIQKNKVSGTKPITLIQSTNEPGVILFAPVYKKGFVRGDNPQENEANAVGVLSGIFQTKNLVQDVLHSDENPGIKKLFLENKVSVLLEDKTDLAHPFVLYSNQLPLEKNDSIKKLIQRLSVQYVYDFGGQEWVLTLSPTGTYLYQLFSWNSWLTLIFSMLFLGIVNLFLLVISGQQIQIRETVKEKTVDLFTSEMQKSLILDAVDEGVVGLDENGKITFLNSESKKILGYDYDELIEKYFHDVIQNKKLIDRITSEKKSSFHEMDYAYKKNGERIQIEYSKKLIIENNNLTGLVISFRDVTEREKAKNASDILQSRDPLTGFLNYNKFKEQVSLLINRSNEDISLFAVCVVDIDRFRNINIQYGFEVGDAVLKLFADRFNAFVRPGDFVARWGGDKFLLCIDNIGSADNLQSLLKQYLKMTVEAILVKKISLKLSVCLGVSIYPVSAGDADELIQCADIALYRAKPMGESQYVIFEKKA